MELFLKTSGCEVDAQVTLNSRNGEIVSVSDCILLEQNNNGLTALHMAVEYDYYWVAKRLLEAEANGDIESNLRATKPSWRTSRIFVMLSLNSRMATKPCLASREKRLRALSI